MLTMMGTLISARSRAALRMLSPTWTLKHFLDEDVHDRQADEAPHDAGDGREQFDDDLQRLLDLPAELGNKHGRAQARRARR